jgi:hypothetical protein
MHPRIAPVRTLALAVIVLFALSAGAAHAAAKLPLVTISQYEHGTVPATLQTQGCNAGKARKVGLVILDFGRPAYKNGAYGTLDFSGVFQWNVPISKAVEAYISGYMNCRPAGLKGVLSVARGTSDSCSNSDMNCCPNGCNIEPPSFTKAGYAWAVRTNQVEQWIMQHGWRYKVRATAAIDAEPAWDPPYHETGNFLNGFDHTALHSGWKLAPRLWDFGSAEPGYWSNNQLWTVAYGGSGINHPLPEIYFPGMAREWEDLSAYAVLHHGGKIVFAGITSQWAANASQCGYSPLHGMNQLLAALRINPATVQTSISRVTDFPCASPSKTSAALTAITGTPPDVYGHDGIPCRSIKVC